VAELKGADQVHGWVAFPASLTAVVEEYRYSPGYGELVPARRLLLTWRGALPVRWVWWVLF
jgi:hypothetical protein